MVDVKKQDSKVLMMVALLSDYDLILVVQDGEKRDYISGIDCLKSWNTMIQSIIGHGKAFWMYLAM